MTTKKLTDFSVRNLKAPATGRLEIWDTTTPGFGIRITDKGAKSWFVMYRVGSGEARKQRRLTLGNASVISLAAARQAAKDALEKVEKGIDPAEQAPTEPDAPATLKAAAQSYLDREMKKRSAATYGEAKRTFEVDIFPTLGDRPLQSIRRHEISDLIDFISQGKRIGSDGKEELRRLGEGDDAKEAGPAPIHANRCMARLRAFFNWAIDEEYLDASPMEKMKAVARETARDRVLSDDELRWFWKACEDIAWPFGSLFKLLLLTAQRRDEVGTIEWPEIDKADRMWTIPKEKAKNGRAHQVPLSQQVLDLLEDCPKFKLEEAEGEKERFSPIVFTTNGRTPVSGFSKVKERLDKKMNDLRRKELDLAEDDPDMEPFILHDLRRTATTGMAKLNIAPHVVDKILNHVTGNIQGVAAVYNRHGYIDERRVALEAWARYVETLITGKPANVHHLQTGVR